MILAQIHSHKPDATPILLLEDPDAVGIAAILATRANRLPIVDHKHDLDGLGPGQELGVRVKGEKEFVFTVRARIDSAIELDYYRNGGILQTVLRRLAL